MLTLLIHSRTAWDDYFTESPTIIQTTLYEERQTPSYTNLHVLNCLFKSITSTSAGGALFCNSVTYLLVESTSFFSCKAYGNGGAIYFANTGSGQSVYHEVCGFDCFSTNSGNGPFSYNEINDAALSKNYINSSSIVRCMGENSTPGYMICHHYGTHCYPSVNISMNKCSLRPGIYSVPYKNSNSVTCSISYSTFADNNATGYVCIQLWMEGAKFEVKSCNIIRNTQGDLGTYGTIFTNGNVMFKDSCILENKANYIFYQYSSYTITLSNCTVDKTTNNGRFTIQNTVTKSFIHALNHMSTQNCNAKYDVIGTLTPIVQPSLFSKKQKLYYSCQILFPQPRLRDVVSLTSILFFNFIHSYTSGYPFY
jgi:hypothetical protein